MICMQRPAPGPQTPKNSGKSPQGHNFTYFWSPGILKHVQCEPGTLDQELRCARPGTADDASTGFRGDLRVGVEGLGTVGASVIANIMVSLQGTGVWGPKLAFIQGIFSS